MEEKCITTLQPSPALLFYYMSKKQDTFVLDGRFSPRLILIFSNNQQQQDCCRSQSNNVVSVLSSRRPVNVE